jgi:hypothetical protein
MGLRLRALAHGSESRFRVDSPKVGGVFPYGINLRSGSPRPLQDMIMKRFALKYLIHPVIHSALGPEVGHA